MFNVGVDRIALDDEGIDLEETFDLQSRNLQLGNALKSFLDPRGLTYTINDDRLLLTTFYSALPNTVVYDVTDLLAAGGPQRVAVVRRGVTSSSFDFEQLITLIQDQCAMDDWEHVGGPGHAKAAELNGKQLLIVSLP